MKDNHEYLTILNDYSRIKINKYPAIVSGDAMAMLGLNTPFSPYIICVARGIMWH